MDQSDQSACLFIGCTGYMGDEKKPGQLCFVRDYNVPLRATMNQSILVE